MKEDAVGDYLKFNDDEELVLEIMDDPIRGESQFTDKDGNPKPQWTFSVREQGSKKIRKWSVSSKPLLQQLVGIMRKEGIQSAKGCVLRVTASGSGKNRTYLVKLLSKGA